MGSPENSEEHGPSRHLGRVRNREVLEESNDVESAVICRAPSAPIANLAFPFAVIVPDEAPYSILAAVSDMVSKGSYHFATFLGSARWTAVARMWQSTCELAGKVPYVWRS